MVTHMKLEMLQKLLAWS